jgi:short-subunit dehydrogenase involved in D-alanine esterification of teichoic acids
MNMIGNTILITGTRAGICLALAEELSKLDNWVIASTRCSLRTVTRGNHFEFLVAHGGIVRHDFYC